MESKPFALGFHRAEWITTKGGRRVVRITGGMNQIRGTKGMHMTPYIAKAFAQWLSDSVSDGRAEHER